MEPQLARQGWARISGSPSLYRVAAQHAGGRGVFGLSKIPESLRLDPPDAHALAADLLIVAIDAFRTKTLMIKERTWTASGGASLKTYFVGRRLMELPDVYTEWQRREKRPLEDLDTAHLVDDGRLSLDPADHAATAAELSDALNGDDRARVMFLLQNAGYSVEEIADMLTSAGIPATQSSVWTRMSRVRQTARERRSH